MKKFLFVISLVMTVVTLTFTLALSMYILDPSSIQKLLQLGVISSSIILGLCTVTNLLIPGKRHWEVRKGGKLNRSASKQRFHNSWNDLTEHH